MDILLTGTGTSHGMPVIGCTCPNCTSTDPKDNRLRTSCWIRGKDSTSIIVDTGPEFRIQALKYNINSLDGVLITHSHADHVHGLDDLRVYSRKKTIPIYSNKNTITDLYNRFDYIFKDTQEGGGKPHLAFISCEQYTTKNALKLGSLQIVPVPIKHGTLEVCGWKICEGNASFAYITDCNYISKESIALIQKVDVLVIDGLRKRHHSTHFNFDEALEVTKQIMPQKAFFTHICHEHNHREIIEYVSDKQKGLPFQIAPSYDGMTLHL